MDKFFGFLECRFTVIKILFISLFLLFNWNNVLALQQKYTVEVLLGVNDKVRTNWDGEARITGGKIEKIEGRFINGSDRILENNQWILSSHIDPEVDYIQWANPHSIDSVAKAVIITLNGNDDTRLLINTTQGAFDFTIGSLRYGTRHPFLQGQIEVLKLPYVENVNPGGEDDDHGAVLCDKDGTI